MLTLRPYQTDIIERVRAKLRSVGSVLVQSPTGSGKTALTAHMLSTAAARGFRAWFVVHRVELVRQSVLTLNDAANLPTGIVAAGFPSNRHEMVQVCSVSTLIRRWHLLTPPDLIVWDESHHVAAKSWADLRQRFSGAKHIGLTATPQRLDGQGLRQYFEDMVVGPSVRELIDAGFLSDYRMFAPGGADLSGVHLLGGDYNKKELAEAMSRSTVVGDALTHYQKHAAGKRAVAFTWSVDSSRQLAERFNAAGIPAEHVDGDTDEITRQTAMQNFRDGKTLVLCNCELFSEGVDVPAIEAVIMLRPTQSLALYLQQAGRALRPSPGKDRAIILDHAGNSKIHGLIDDPRDWTLDGRVKRKTKSDAAPIRQCPMCYAVVSAASSTCRHCGHKFEIQQREIEQIDGELAEVDVAAARHERLREQASAKTLEELVVVGRLRKLKNPEGWAKHVWKARLAKQAAKDAEQWARGVA